MPLVAWTVLVYAAALIAALGGSDALRIALCGATLLATVGFHVRRRRIPSLLSAVAAGAVLVAISTLSRDTQCARRLGALTAWSVEFDGDVHAGDLARVNLRADGCETRGVMVVGAGRAAGGEIARVSGRASVGQRGLLVADAVIGTRARGSLLIRARVAAGRRIDRIFGTDAPMARALVIADMSAIGTAQRDRYADAGLVHMLSVSGLHVGIVALALELLASVLRLPRMPARVATLVLLAIYVAAIGAPPPAVRAAVMLGVLLVSRLVQRPTSPWAILALGAAAPLWDPRTVLDVGWQLSVAGTAALVSGGALGKRIIPEDWSGTRRNLAAGVVVSLVATAATAPLVAWTFGRVALPGPVTNLLADPVMALLQPLLFLAIAVPIRGVESFAADASHALLFAFDAIARGAAAIPYAAPSVLPSVVGAVAAGVASVALLAACVARRPATACLLGGVAIAVLIIEPAAPHAARAPELHMIDVGQGDAFALRTGRGRWIVIDAGRSWDGGDAGRSTVAPYLARRGGDVALFVLSHPHADHVGGAASLFAMRPPGRFLDPGYVGTTPPYRAALAAARGRGIPWQRVHPGDSLIVDDIVLTALAPDSTWAARLDDANLASSVLLVRVGSFRVLFTGDAEAQEEEWLLDHARDALRADVLKVAHHGSSTSTTPAFLDAVRPRVALVSVGAHNTYGHPDAEVMQALQASGAQTLRTDRFGTVVLRFLAHDVEVEARGQTWMVPAQVIR